MGITERKEREKQEMQQRIIDAADEARMLMLLAQGRYGVDGVVDQADFEAFQASFTGPGPGGPVGAVINLHDLDADGDVDAADRQLFYRLVTVPLEPDLDANGDGVFDIDDLYAQTQNPIDANRDGVIDQSDTDRVIFEYRVLTEEVIDPR